MTRCEKRKGVKHMFDEADSRSSLMSRRATVQAKSGSYSCCGILISTAIELSITA